MEPAENGVSETLVYIYITYIRIYNWMDGESKNVQYFNPRNL